MNRQRWKRTESDILRRTGRVTVEENKRKKADNPIIGETRYGYFNKNYC